ncbi:antA/AntB antirepressor family protein [Lysinibacillus sp. KU-BSD001]|uniref:antA/AntB antirepressor family protein n=1 Tax=Lysinibacillus sp. KU-BSD001 TaxID=3141328 RepID=UPI0036E15F30
MFGYGFVENVDFAVIVKNDENPLGGRPKQDHALKLDMAKEISKITLIMLLVFREQDFKHF